MANPFVSQNQNQAQLMQGQPQMQQPNFNQAYQQFAPNWRQYFKNLPEDIQTPEQAVRYFAQNGQIPPLIQRQVYSMLNRR